VSLKGVGYLTDMVIDLSESESSRLVAPTRVRGGYIVASTRGAWRRFWLEPFLQVKRTDYRDYAGDYDETRSGARVEWQHSDALAISIAGFDSRRGYDERVQYTAGGRALPGTHLRFRQRDGEAKVRMAWKDWTFAGSVGQMANRDHASGYFDYGQKRARVELGWAHASWRAAVEADVRRVEYRVQTVGAGLAPPPRINDDYDLSFRAERDLDEYWTIFGEYRWERSRSNEREYSYRANTVLAGVQRAL
jgi:hypothetical protein